MNRTSLSIIHENIMTFFFEREDVEPALCLFRSLLGVAILFFIATEPYSSFFLTFSQVHPELSSQLIYAHPWLLFLLKFLIAISSLSLVFGLWSEYGKYLLAFSFTFYGSNLYHATDELFINRWNGWSHLVIFCFILLIAKTDGHWSLKKTAQENPCPSSRRIITSSFSFSFLQILGLFIYFQAGLSKLIYGFEEWIILKDAIPKYVILSTGTLLGNDLVKYSEVFHILSIVVVIFEISIIFFFIKTWRQSWKTGCLLLTFHLGIWSILGVSFWHLVIFFPALFFYQQLRFFASDH